MRSRFRCAVLLLLTVPVFAQDEVYFHQAAEESFLLGTRQYAEQQFDSALGSFVRVHQIFSLNQRTTAAIVMTAKTLNRLQRYREGYGMSLEFLRLYPGSLYGEDARYTAAFAAERSGDYDTALRWAVSVASRGSERKNVENAKLLMGAVAGKWAADSVARSVAALTDPSERRFAREFFTELSEQKSILFGVLLPLLRGRTDRGQVRMVAQEFLEGMTVAVEDYNHSPRRQGARIALDVRDTGGDSLLAATQAGVLAETGKTLAIIGPLFSAEARTVSKVATAYGIPVISPTATDNGIAAGSPFLFQLNPDYEMRGRALAMYAIQTLGYTRMGIFAPKTLPAHGVCEAFSAEVRKRGGEIVSDIRYPLNTTDLRHLLRAMIADALKRAKVDQVTDTAAVFANYLQAIVCPIDDAAEIGILTPQMRYYNIPSQILGTSEWNDLSELEMNKLYADGVLFCADRWIDDPAAAAEFRARFQQSTGRPPGGNAILGYDVMRFVIASVTTGATNREKLRAQLSHAEPFEGLQTAITLGNRRVNAALRIIQYKKGKLIRIGEITLQ
ncbi:MAG: ABC transporter substrate-binding protein [Ignavibacteriales bacterium]|nr:ABC transporter substrate-binding protein [Ignavibacteriales bacterium]